MPTKTNGDYIYYLDSCGVVGRIEGCISATAEMKVVRSFNLEQIKKIIINEPATIILWKDGTKTVVKLKDGDTFDPEKGILLCILKKMFDNSSTKMGKWLDEQTKQYVAPFTPVLKEYVDAMLEKVGIK